MFETELPGLREMEDGTWQFCLENRLYRLSGEALRVEELPTTVIDVPKPARSDLHPTMKPVALIEPMVANSSPRGGLVGDFFGGSGSTLMACERLGRSARLMEADPKFAEVIIRRWQDYSGGQAVRENDGVTFAELTGEGAM